MNKGNKHAAKPDEDRATSFLHIRCKRSDKSKWVKQAHPGKLSQWVINKLNEANQ